MSEHHVYFCVTAVVACENCSKSHGKSFGKQFQRAALMKVRSECHCPEGFSGVMVEEPPVARKCGAIDSGEYEQFAACVDLLLIAEEPVSTQKLQLMVAHSGVDWVRPMKEVVTEMLRWFDVERIDVKAEDKDSGQVAVTQYWRLHSKEKVEAPVDAEPG